MDRTQPDLTGCVRNEELRTESWLRSGETTRKIYKDPSTKNQIVSP
jgi:hypothetical protein